LRLDAEFHRKKAQTKAGRNIWGNRRSFAAAQELVKKKVKISRSVAAAQYFANLNSLEFILLGCGILTCLAGIMFQASATDLRALVRYQDLVVTWLLIVVVISSLVYIAIFLLAETFPTLVVKCLEACQRRETRERVASLDQPLDQQVELEENPMFSAPKVAFADHSELEGQLQSSFGELQKAEKQNKALRDELKEKKQAAQLEETRRAGNGPVPEENDRQFKRKEFAQTRLTSVLTGDKRQRARGGKKSAAQHVAEDDDGGVGDDTVATYGV